MFHYLLIKCWEIALWIYKILTNEIIRIKFRQIVSRFIITLIHDLIDFALKMQESYMKGIHLLRAILRKMKNMT